MKIIFEGPNYSPYIKVYFNNNSVYKYSGFELGFISIIKRKFYKRPGKLVVYLKTLKSIIVEKINEG